MLAVLYAVEAVREAHPELQHGLTGARLRRVLKREGIDVVPAAVRKSRAIVDDEGNAAILLSVRGSVREQWKRLAHEYGHVKLHFAERGEIVRNIVPCRKGDPREDDANLFAALLVLGPTETIEHPTAAAIVAKMVAAEHVRRMPEQTRLELPEPAPKTKPPAAIRPAINPALLETYERESERDYQRRVARRGGNIRKAVDAFTRAPDVRRTNDDDRILFFDPARGAARFTDLDGRFWWIYNYRIADLMGKPRWERVGDFMSPEVKYRFFVNSLGDRRVYRFSDRREQRAYRSPHLDRQLASATQFRHKTNRRSHAQAQRK